MRIGMIFECGPVRPDGTGAPDVKVYEFLAKQLLPKVEIQSRTLNSKPGLIRDCGITSKLLLDVNHCDRVIIIWDLQPPWKGKKGKACRKEDCDAIRESLDRAGLTAEQLRCVHLVCMEHELETLLLADERAIAAY